MRVAVIGGGFAGLAASVELAKSGVQVALLEARRHLGGRAYSFRHTATGDTVDNGQHLFMRCYQSTRDFLDRIGTADLLSFQDGFRVDFSHPEMGEMALAFPRRGPRSYRILRGFLRFKPFRLADLPGLARVERTLNDPASDQCSAADWLDSTGQSSALRESFWDPLCIAALNRVPAEASARDLRAVLREAFFGRPDGADMGYAGGGLSALYTEASRQFIESHEGKVRSGAAAQCLTRLPDGSLEVGLKADERIEADAVIAAVPPPALLRILPDGMRPLRETLSRYRPSPILSVNLWLDRPVMRKPVLGLLGTEMQWVFCQSALYAGRDRAAPGHITLVASAADALVGLSDDALVEMALSDLRTHLPEAGNATCTQHLVIRERRATYDLAPSMDRPGNTTDWPGLYVAGDWTDTGLPATIEGAVSSGQDAARLAVNFCSARRT